MTSQIDSAAPLKTVGRNLWGWFVVCVWIVGVPNVLRYAAIGTRDAWRATTCATTGYSCPTIPTAPAAFDSQEEAIKYLLDANPGTKLKLVPSE